MRWMFRDEDLIQQDAFGDLLRSIFELMKPQLEYDEMRFLWIVRRSK